LGHRVEILTSQAPIFSPIFKSFRKNNPQIKIHYLKLLPEEQKIYKEQPGKRWVRWDIESLYFSRIAAEFYLTHKNRWNLVITHLLLDSLFIPRHFINILHLHGVPKERRAIDDIALRRPDGFIAVAKFVKNGWRTLYPWLKERQIQICYNGINTKNFPDLNLNRDIDLLFVGRLLEIKGLYVILDALKALIRWGVDFNQLIIVGDGPEKVKIKYIIKTLRLSKKVKLISNIPYKKLINLYNRAKIFLCPSYEREGVLTAMLEAASCGSSIITADCCGMTEFAKDNINSLLTEPTNSNDLAKKIKVLLENDNLRTRLAQRAEKDIHNHWDSLKTGQLLEQTYLKFYKQKKYDC